VDFREKMESKKYTQKENSVKFGQENAQLVSRLAHEIKNPLSTIKINLKLIAEDLDNLRERYSQPSTGPERLDEDKLASASELYTEKSKNTNFNVRL
jgi:signal transduction histidine kinase